MTQSHSPYQIRIVQVFRVERAIVITVDAPDMETAIEMQNDRDAPAFDDPRWSSSWSLENEEVDPAYPG